MCSSPSALLDQVMAGAADPGAEIVALVELADRVQAELVTRAGVFDASEQWAGDGAYSFACWLRARADISRAEASQLTQFARLLRTMPATEAAVADGRLSVAKARLLARAVNDRTRARFDEHETYLVDHLEHLDVDAAKVTIRYWQRLADTDGPDPADRSRNWASITKGWDDRWHLEADLDPVTGAIVKSVLDALVERMHADGRFTDRTPSPGRPQQMAEAIEEMATRSTGAGPGQHAVRAEIVVVVPVERLTEPEPDPVAPPPVLIGTGPVSITDVLRLAVLGHITKMTVDRDGRPLNLGRRQRLATGDQWIALHTRDRGCVVPGCDRPAGWCSAHHLKWWDRDHGTTDLANLALVCSAHHHLIHDQQWTLHQQPDGRWCLTRPDGTTVYPPRYPDHHRPRSSAPARQPNGGVAEPCHA